MSCSTATYAGERVILILELSFTCSVISCSTDTYAGERVILILASSFTYSGAFLLIASYAGERVILIPASSFTYNVLNGSSSESVCVPSLVPTIRHFKVKFFNYFNISILLDIKC